MVWFEQNLGQNQISINSQTMAKIVYGFLNQMVIFKVFTLFLQVALVCIKILSFLCMASYNSNSLFAYLLPQFYESKLEVT